jgi:hypothetical protein
MRRKLLALALLICAAAPAAGADDAAKSAATKVPNYNVQMPFLMAPMTGADGKLAGYAYLSPQLNAGSDTATQDVREKLPFIQDAFVRDINGAAVTTAADPATVDVPAVEARLLADARRVMGAAKVKAVIICTVQIAELHPRQTQALVAPPELSTAKPVKPRCDS